MEAEDLSVHIDYLSPSGRTLTPEQRAAFQTSLPALKAHYAFGRVIFWGAVQGTTGDILIAQGFEKSFTFSRTRTFVSDDQGVSWKELQRATPEEVDAAHRISGMFSGNLAHTYKIAEDVPVDGQPSTQKKTSLKEERRIAALVDAVDQDTSVVPCGSFILNAGHEISRNRAFEGLEGDDSTKLTSYVHLRPSQVTAKKTALQREVEGLTSADFLDDLSESKRQWSVQFDATTGAVTIRSLLWPGYHFYHVPGTPRFGSFYFGNGEKNVDISFML